MTIADFIRAFLDSRRKKYGDMYKKDIEESYRDQESISQQHQDFPSHTNIDAQTDYLLRMFGLTPPSEQTECFESSDGCDCEEKRDKDLDGRISVRNVEELLDKSYPNNSMALVSNPERNTTVRQFGISQSSKVIRLPDGTVQIETITRDAKGNIEKKITYKKGDKTYTVIKKIDQYGNEKVEENVSDTADGVLDFKDSWHFGSDFDSSDNSGYDYWYNKLFKKKEETTPEFPTKPMLPPELEQQIDTILKTFGFDRTFDPFRKSGKSDSGGISSILDDFVKQSGVMDENGPFIDETRKFLEQPENKQFKSPVGKYKRRSGKKKDSLDNQINGIFSKSRAPSLFGAMDDEAKIMLPDEETPFDKYVKPDEEKHEKWKTVRQKTANYLNQLQKYLDSSNEKDSKSESTDVFISPVPSKPDIKINPPANGFGLQNDVTVSKNEIQFSDGRVRSEVVKKYKNGYEERNIVYKFGNRIYNVVITTDANGTQRKRTNAVNFDDDELNKFSKLWDDEYRSDFEK